MINITILSLIPKNNAATDQSEYADLSRASFEKRKQILFLEVNLNAIVLGTFV